MSYDKSKVVKCNKTFWILSYADGTMGTMDINYIPLFRTRELANKYIEENHSGKGLTAIEVRIEKLSTWVNNIKI